MSAHEQPRRGGGEAEELLQRADPLQHRQPARQRARRPGVPRRAPRRGGLRVRAARRRARAPEPRRAAARRGAPTGPTLCYLGHVDTVLADPAEWTPRPVVGRHRRRLPVGPRRARHEVAGGRRDRGRGVAGALGLAPGARRAADRGGRRRGDRRRARRAVDHRDAPREGALRPARQRGRRRGVRVRRAGAATACAAPRRACSASRVSTDGVAGHASMPGMGENALLKMAPVLERLAARQPSYQLDRRAARVPARDRRGPRRPASGSIARLRAADPRLATMFEPMLGVTFTPDADQRLGEDQRDPQPRRAEGRLPRAARARRGGGARGHRRGARRRARTAAWRIEFTEQVVGNRSPIALAADGRDRRRGSPSTTRAPRWCRWCCPASPTRATSALAFPECVAYGFFPQRHQSLLETAPLIHGADERIDVRDLAFATRALPATSRARVLG